MESLKELYKIGRGPSSSHTMGPYKAAINFKKNHEDADEYAVTLYGSLAATGKGHLTDVVLKEAFAPNMVNIYFNPDIVYTYHPNGMLLEAFKNGNKIDEELVFSVGGGSLKHLNEARDKSKDDVYYLHYMKDIMSYCEGKNISLLSYILENENDILDYLNQMFLTMEKSVKNGLYKDGIIPGGLNVERKASHYLKKYLNNPSLDKLVYAASLAVAEENASGGEIVTAPTCGSSGVVPGVLYALKVFENYSNDKIAEALAIAGLIGNLAKENASISGAEVGCQGEVGVACSMAAAAITYLKDGTTKQIEYAAEIALEHHLGMTCDPINGLVQIPCIERNAISAMQAFNCSNYALFSDGLHRISLDEAIFVMNETGKDLQEKYRETSKGGLAGKRGKYE